MSSAEPFNTLGGYSVGIPPELVIDGTGNVVNNVNAPNSNVTANRIFANAYLYANGDPLSIGASGSNTQVQYNNNGLLGASSAFTFNSSTNLLTVTNLQVGNRANLGNVSNVVILGGTNGYFLQTDGAGNLTWAPAGNGGNTGNGVPGGANTQVQFNDAGQFGGDAGFTYNKVSNTLSIANTISAGNAITGVNLSVTDATIYNTLSVTDVIASNITLSANITNANWINASYFAGNGHSLFGLVGANVTGQVGFANVANNVAGANVSGTVGFANVANNVAGANVTGQVANALVAGTVYTNAQPNITSVGNLISLTVVGNTTLGNQVVSNYFIGNLFGLANNARTVTFGAQPNITSLGTLTSLNVSGNTTLGNSVTANVFVGNLHGVANSAVTASSALQSNTANFANVANFANYSNFAGSTEFCNTANFANNALSVNAANIVGQVANALVAGTVYINSQPNITSVGTLTGLAVIGNVNATNVNANFSGNGSRIFNITGANVSGTVANATYAVTAGTANTASNATTAGTVTTNAQPNITSLGVLTGLTVAGNVSATNVSGSFAGNGFRLFNINAANISGSVSNATYANTAGSANTANTATTANTAATVTTNAQPNITSLGNLTALSVIGNVSAGNVLSNFIGNGAGLTSIPAANVVGTVANANYAAFANVAQTTNVSIHSNTANTVVNNAQPNITSVGTLTSLNVVGSISSGNVFANTGIISANILLGTLNTSSQPNITTVGTLTALNVAGNITAGNINAGNLLTANFISGTLTTNAQQNINYLGNIGWLNVDTAVPNSNGNITFNGSMSGTGVGSNITITGNLAAGNSVAANFLLGTITTNLQPNITTVGNLTSLTVLGQSNLGDAGNVKILGGNANYVLSTDGTGNLSWVAQTGGNGGGVPGGSNSQIQFNSNNTFAGSGSLSFNDTIKFFYLAGNANITGTANVLTNFNTANINSNGTANFTGTTNLGNTTLLANRTLTISGNLNAAAAPNVNLGNVANITISGGVNGYVLSTDGLGNLSWKNAGGGNGGGTPGGSNTQVQYNDAGTFGGSGFFTFNEATNSVHVAGNLTANSFTMGSGVYEFCRSNVFFATTSSTSQQVLLSLDADDLAAIDYTIISDDGPIRNFIKISAVVSGNVVNYVEYSTLPVNGYTGDFAVTYNAGNVIVPATVQLVMTPQSANLMTHKMMVTTYNV
jgi:hypothetical protein